MNYDEITAIQFELDPAMLSPGQLPRTVTNQFRDPSQEELRAVFTYDGENLHWKSTGKLAVARALKDGRKQVNWAGRTYNHARLVFIWLNGAITPGFVVHHDDDDKMNDTESNLFAIPYWLNNLLARRPDSKYGVPGVQPTAAGKWQLTVCDRQVGTFTTLQAARTVRENIIWNARFLHGLPVDLNRILALPHQPPPVAARPTLSQIDLILD